LERGINFQWFINLGTRNVFSAKPPFPLVMLGQQCIPVLSQIFRNQKELMGGGPFSVLTCGLALSLSKSSFSLSPLAYTYPAHDSVPFRWSTWFQTTPCPPGCSLDLPQPKREGQFGIFKVFPLFKRVQCRVMDVKLWQVPTDWVKGHQ
jgi:hypothetical protein